MRASLETLYAQLMVQSQRRIKKGEAVAPHLANMILSQAIEVNASDIHFEPKPQGVVVRFRIDGILHDMLTIPPDEKINLVPCIKVMANIDSGTGGSIVPKDGRLSFSLGNLSADIRANSFPNLFGEKIALRILIKERDMMSLDKLGFYPQILESYRRLLKNANGMLLVTGPTGSGKTTTLYSTLAEIYSPEINVCTLEDPIEYEVAEYNQAAINPRRDFTFALGLRALLRQDPDVILVGEVRDEETAEVAVRAALTGHLILSTLHTNDAGSTVVRLLDMGIDPYLLANCLRGVVSQRLARKLCPHCCEDDPAAAKWFEKNNLLKSFPNARTRKGRGCAECFETGWRGRTGIFELLAVNDQLRDLIGSEGARSNLSKIAASMGMASLQYDGLHKVADGITSLQEILRLVLDTS